MLQLKLPPRPPAVSGNGLPPPLPPRGSPSPQGPNFFGRAVGSAPPSPALSSSSLPQTPHRPSGPLPSEPVSCQPYSSFRRPPDLLLTRAVCLRLPQITLVGRSDPLSPVSDDATNEGPALPSSPPRPPLRRDATVIPPSPSSKTAPALPARTLAVPPTSPPPGYDGPSSGPQSGSPSPFILGGLVQPSSPYQSPWIPPPTPTPPDIGPYDEADDEVDDEAELSDPRLSLMTLPFDGGGSITSSTASTPADEVDDVSGTDEAVYSPSADFETVSVPMLRRQSSSFPEDQRSSDLTTISEERSSRMMHSTRSNSLATSGRTGSGSASGGRGPRNSTFSGGWETLESAGLRKSRQTSAVRQNTSETVKTADGTPSARSASADAGQSPTAAESTALVVVSEPVGTLQVLNRPVLLQSPSEVDVATKDDPKPLTPAEQIVSDEAHRTPQPVRRRSFSASEVLAAAPVSSPPASGQRSPFLTPLRPPRSLSRPLSSSSGTLPTRPDLTVIPPSDEHIATRRSSVGSDKNLPALPVQPSPPALSANGSSTTLQPTISRSSLSRQPPLIGDPSDTPGLVASATSLASSAVLARYVDALGSSADDLVRHGQALSASAVDMADRARVIRHFALLPSGIDSQGKATEDDDPRRMLEASLALYKAGSELVARALDLGRTALERAGEQTRAARADEERVREEAEKRRTTAEREVEEERLLLEEERAALERAKVVWENEKARQAARSAASEDDTRSPTLALSPPSPRSPAINPTGALSPGRFVDSPFSTADDVPTPAGPPSPWKLFGSTAASRKARRASSSSAPDAVGKSGDGGAALAAAQAGRPRKWGLKKRANGSGVA